VLGTGGVSGDEGEADVGLGEAVQLPLGLLGGLSRGRSETKRVSGANEVE